MDNIKQLLEKNRIWAEGIKAQHPEFFSILADEHAPHYLWIGCSDSRVPATQLIDSKPGELFVHRNVANLVVHTDFNCLSVLQYAVEVLKVDHVIVCGHYGCGGVQAAMRNLHLGLIDNWLRHVQDVQYRHEAYLSTIADENERANKLCELNVIEQVVSVGRTTIVQNAWRSNQKLAVHGWIYGIGDGLIHDLEICLEGNNEVRPKYEKALRTSGFLK